MLQRFVDALNSVHDNIWALGIILGGAFACHKDPAVGGNLITLGAAVFQRSVSQSQNSKLTTLNLSDHKESKQ